MSLLLVGCGGGSSSAAESTSGAAFTSPSTITVATFNEGGASMQNNAYIDTSSLSQGYVAAKAYNGIKLKFLVTCGEMSYAYDLPGDGTPIICPLNMGSGTYMFRVMQNTAGDNYVAIATQTEQVALSSEFSPYLINNVFCDYSESSACVATARQLVQNAGNQGDALAAVCTYIIQNIKYDDAKAAQLANASGYVPDPDSTLSSGTGICFDYASLAAAMLRSQGIPTQIVTGYVSPGNIYHAWVMVYIDGTWKSAKFQVSSKTWTRVDLTFASESGSVDNVGDGNEYTNRYTY